MRSPDKRPRLSVIISRSRLPGAYLHQYLAGMTLSNFSAAHRTGVCHAVWLVIVRELLRTLAVWHAHPEEIRQGPTVDVRFFPASYRHPGYDRLPRGGMHLFAGRGVYSPGLETKGLKRDESYNK